MSRQRPRRSRSLVSKVRGKFDKNRRSRSLEPVNVFASDMVSTRFILDRLQKVEANNKVVRLEVEDLIVNANRDLIIPTVKNLLVRNHDRGWKAVSFLDSFGTDQFQWWVHLKHKVMADFNAALGHTNLKELCLFQANVQVQEGTSLRQLIDLLKCIRCHHDVFHVSFSGALFGYGEASIGVAMADAVDPTGTIVETITINVKYGWKTRGFFWSNMLDACIRAAVDLAEELRGANDNCDDSSPAIPVDFPGVALGGEQREGKARNGLPRRSRSTNCLAGLGHRSSVLSRVQAFEQGPNSATGTRSTVTRTKKSVAAKSNEEPSYSWETARITNKDLQKTSNEQPAYSWEHKSFTSSRRDAVPTDDEPDYSWGNERKSRRSKGTSNASVSSDPIKQRRSAKRRIPQPRRHSASATTTLRAAAEPPAKRDCDPWQSNSSESDCQFNNRKLSKRRPVDVDSPRAPSKKIRQPPRRSKSIDFQHPSLPATAARQPPRRSKSIGFHQPSPYDGDTSNREAPRRNQSIDFQQPSLPARAATRRSKSIDFQQPSLLSRGTARRSKSIDFQQPSLPARAAARRSKSIDFQQPSLPARATARRSKSIDFQQPSLSADVEQISWQMYDRDESGREAPCGSCDSSMQQSASGGKRSTRSRTKEMAIRHPLQEQVKNNPVKSGRRRLGRSKSTVLPTTRLVSRTSDGVHDESIADPGPAFDWTAKSQLSKKEPKKSGKHLEATAKKKRLRRAKSAGLATLQAATHAFSLGRKEGQQQKQSSVSSKGFGAAENTEPMFDWSSHGPRSSKVKEQSHRKGRKSPTEQKCKGFSSHQGATFDWASSESMSASKRLADEYNPSVSESEDSALSAESDNDWTTKVLPKSRTSPLQLPTSIGDSGYEPDFDWSVKEHPTRSNEKPQRNGVSGEDESCLSTEKAPDYLWGEEKQTSVTTSSAPCHDWASMASKPQSTNNITVADHALSEHRWSSRRPKLIRSLSEASTLCQRTESPTSVVADDFCDAAYDWAWASNVMKKGDPDHNWLAINLVDEWPEGHDFSKVQPTKRLGGGMDKSKSDGMPSHARRRVASQYSLAGFIG